MDVVWFYPQSVYLRSIFNTRYRHTVTVGSGAVERSVITRWRLVDKMLHDCSVCHCKRSEHEAHSDSCDGSERNANLSEERVEQTITNGYKDDDREWINVLHEVVGNAVELHNTSWKMSAKIDTGKF